MDDINSIAITLHTNTKQQGVTLVKVNENMDTAQTNAVDAHENIEKALTHQKSGNKWLKWILIVMGCFALFAIIFMIIFWNWKKL